MGNVGYIFDGSAEVKEGLRGLCYRGLVSPMAHSYHHRGVHSRKKECQKCCASVTVPGHTQVC
jgi:hypothetical protein